MPAWVAAAAALYLAVMLVAMGLRRRGYSHVRHTISELGEFGSVLQRPVAWGVFLPVGLGLLVVAWLAKDLSRDAAGLALSFGAFAFRGLVQRVAEGALFGGLALALVQLAKL